MLETSDASEQLIRDSYIPKTSLHSEMSKFGVLVMGPAGAGKVCAFTHPSR